MNRPNSTSLYSANLTAGSLKLRESRLIAGLLLDGVDDEGYREAVTQDNILQCRTVATAVRLARLIRGRLELFDSGLWKMVRDGQKTVAIQGLFAAAVKHSSLLRDFIDLALRDEFRLLHTHLAPGLWWSFLDGCAGRDLAVSKWSEATRRRLRSTVYQILAQVGFLNDTKGRELQKVTIVPELSRYLMEMGDHALLNTIQIP